MSSGGTAKEGVHNFKRRTWDTEEYEKRALEREDGEHNDETALDVRERLARAGYKNSGVFQIAELGAAGPAASERAFLKARTQRVDLESRVNKTTIVAAGSGAKDKGAYYCPVCECDLRDSQGYLDHINGKRHQRRLGFSMRVQKSTVSDVKRRLNAGSKRRCESDALADYDYEARLAELKEQEMSRKRAKKAAKEKKRAEKEEAASELVSEMDPEMMQMMGFGGFGGSNKS